MVTKTITTNTDTAFGIDAKSRDGFRVMTYSGSLGGGSLQVLTKPNDALTIVPVPNAKLTVAKVDSDGAVVQQLTFQSAGQVIIRSAGGTGMNAEVSIL